MNSFQATFVARPGLRDSVVNEFVGKRPHTTAQFGQNVSVSVAAPTKEEAQRFIEIFKTVQKIFPLTVGGISLDQLDENGELVERTWK